jgi:hypothetical protein
MNHSKLHNPVYVGPGIWFTIHTLAANSRTDSEKEDVIRHIRKLQDRFPCLECKGHFGEYLSKHPPEDTLGGNEDALFLWTVNFHNAVNYRLKKPQVSYEEAKSIFMENDIFCTKKCDEESESKSSKEAKTIINLFVNSDTKGPKLVPKDIPLYLR